MLVTASPTLMIQDTTSLVAGVNPYLGIDTEFVPLFNGSPLFPHLLNLDQDRVAKTHSGWKNHVVDWHGDGYAFELCTEPVKEISTLLQNVSTGFRLLGRRIYKTYNQTWTPRDKVLLWAPPIYSIPEEIVANAPERVQLLGCAPSFNVYPGDFANPKVLASNERSTGTHLHISHPFLTTSDVVKLVKWADVMVGAVWTYISPENPEEESRRRQAYGRAGEHRFNIYPIPPGNIPSRAFEDATEWCGVEYRVLPGRVAANPVYLSLMLILYREALRETLISNSEPTTSLSELAREAINKADKTIAAEVLRKLRISDQDVRLLNYYSRYSQEFMYSGQWYRAGQRNEGVIKNYMMYGVHANDFELTQKEAD